MKKHADSSATACFCFIVKAFGFNLTQRLYNKPRAAKAARENYLFFDFLFFFFCCLRLFTVSATCMRP